MNTKEFGIRVRNLRTDRNISLEKLASMVEMTKQGLSRVETNKNKKINEHLLSKLAYALQCTEDYLRGDSECPELNKNGMREPIRFIPHSDVKEEFIYLIRKQPLENFEMTKAFIACLKYLSSREQKLLTEIMKVILKNKNATKDFGVV